MINRRQILVGGAAIVATPAYLRKAWAQTPEVELKLHHFLGPKAPAHSKMLEPWAQRIQDQSEGRVKIELYPAMSLGGSPPQLFRQVAEGVVDIVWTVNGYTPGLFPRSEAFELPTVFTNDLSAANLAMRDMFDEYLSPDFADVKVLFMHVHAGQALQMAEKLVRSPDDTKGLKLRVPGPTGNAVVEAMGATPVTMPVPDLPQALSTNAVDGALIPWEIIPPLQLFESTKYQIEGPDNNRFGTTTFQVSMNKSRWDGLPDDLQQIFADNSGEDWLREVADIWRGADDFGIKMAVDNGNEHIVLSDAEMAAFNTVLAPVVDQWVGQQSGFDAAALVAAARQTMAARQS
ncbi:TRAP transporter substrate-binding protein [Puniceibacterium sediminis]|uniref:TRAP-type C4-dicarboxylate transport system, substrate-binding protein n=1 Tax=Puniceibacterium sediminis TaxID=1608407 RepID=A0A238Y6F6_9RHOB|nr:TRAP transporter substrate-binding protein [Puniceibacterium sediminis]SNR66552.1 TRAP-type C4-dicarboxylate transport system, substrate-binding protein [Puniceibacterium sediminis]